ncbi:hypothetical protein B0J14DRAFT_604564 [Halenospora varia]|nr:hypothetical protein B0J14DRAFT_604564 [Halenospora varia]
MMPPISSFVLQLLARENISHLAATSNELRQQWAQPTDVFNVLLLLGGDIVNKALAQLSGSVITPVTFSFGWVSYAVKTLLASVGEAKLMPSATESPCLLVTAKNGYIRSNASWVISRILRDYESWMDPAIRLRLEEMLDERQLYMRQKTKKGTIVPRPGQTGLCISIYEPSKSKTAGEPTRDLIYWSGLAVAFIQLAIAAVPISTSGDWSILMITMGGTVLALLMGSLPQWRNEKWACRHSSQNTYILTRGNGAQHAIVILGNGRGLNLEDLAVAGQMKYTSTNILTRLCLVVLSILWVSLLITAAGVRRNTWFLLAVGCTGMLQNMFVAGWRRNPSTLGVHLDFQGVIGKMTAMDALLTVEDKYMNVGRSLLPIFFPGKLLPEEEARWAKLSAKVVQEKEDARAKTQVKTMTMGIESWTSHAKTFEKR